MPWTGEQESAITARGSNLLVAAAAGSGKTAVLVERIISLLTLDQVDIDRLLVVTFTQAAAAEMRGRISQALIERLAQGNPNEEGLRRQLTLLGRASISTIHAFCTEVVRSHFHLVDIDPHFRITDANESELLKLEVLDGLLEQEYEKANPFFLGLVERFGGSRSDQGLQDLILQTYGFIQSQPAPLAWLQAQAQGFALNPAGLEESKWVSALKQQLRLQLEAAHDRFTEAMVLTRVPGGPLPYQEALEHDIDGVESLLGALDSELVAFYDRLIQVEHLRLKPLKRDLDTDLGQQAKDLRDEGKALVQEIRSGILLKSPESMLADINLIYPYMDYLCSLLASFMEAFREKKEKRAYWISTIWSTLPCKFLVMRRLVRSTAADIFMSL